MYDKINTAKNNSSFGLSVVSVLGKPWARNEGYLSETKKGNHKRLLASKI